MLFDKNYFPFLGRLRVAYIPRHDGGDDRCFAADDKCWGLDMTSRVSFGLGGIIRLCLG